MAPDVGTMRAVVHGAIGKTDTFRWLTADVPRTLDERASASTVRLAELRTANQNAASVGGGLTDESFADAVRLSELEIRAQRGLAKWLRSLAKDAR